jgi:hypothetical protein
LLRPAIGLHRPPAAMREMGQRCQHINHPEISVAERVERVRVPIRLRSQMNRQSAELEKDFHHRCVTSHDISAWRSPVPTDYAVRT